MEGEDRKRFMTDNRTAGGGDLAWPPPGLEPLRGALRRMANRFWLGGLLLLATMLPVLLAGVHVGSVFTSIGSTVLLLPAVVGIIVTLVAVRGMIGMGWQTSRAILDGYGWLTVMETLADLSGNTGEIITGASIFALSTPAQRSELRVGRVVAEFLIFASGVAVLPILVLVLALGSSDHAGPNGVWAAVVLPALGLLVAMMFTSHENRTLAALRERSAKKQTVSTKQAASAWNDAFDATLAGGTGGRGSRKTPMAAWFGALGSAVVLVLVIVTLLPLLFVGSLGPAYWTAFRPTFGNSTGKLAIAAVSRPFEVQKDSSIAPLTAGRAFYSLLVDTPPSGRAQEQTVFAERPAPTPALPPRPWHDSLPAALFPTARPDVVPSLPSSGFILQAAAKGLTAQETKYLEQVAHAEQWKAFATVARAPSMDYIGARFVLPFADSVGWWDFPVPRYSSTKELAYAGVARAAFYLSRGRRDSAEFALREIESFGFTLMDNSTTLIDQLIGAVFVGIGRDGLIQFFTVTNDPRGPRLEASRDSIVAIVDHSATPGSMRLEAIDPVRARESARTRANDPNESRGVRAEMLRILAAAPCTSARELVFGPDDDIRETFENAKKTLARFPSDSAVLDMIRDTPERSWHMARREGPALTVARTISGAGALLGNRRLAGCMAGIVSFRM